MAVSYGAWLAPASYNMDKDIVGRFQGGYNFGKGIVDDKNASDLEKNASDVAVRYSDFVTGSQRQAPGMVEASHQAVSQSQDPTLSAYFANIKAAESGGDLYAKNPNSSATGLYQFTDGTWNDLAQNNPQLGLTADGRTDPQQQERAIRAFTGQNAKALSQAGIQVNPGTLYAAHFLGAGGASQALSLPDDTPMATATTPEVIAANPHLQNMTIGDFKQWSAQKGGNSTGGYQPPREQQAQNSLPPADLMRDMFRNPLTRPLAIELAKSAQAGTAPSKAASTVGKLAQDFRNGLIDQGTYDAALNKATAESKGVNVTTNVGEQMTPGWKKIDENFAPEYVKWISGTGADVSAQLENLNNALGLLEGGTAVTGDKINLLPREIQAFINTDGVIAREGVEEVVQRSLRETLGAQFTEKEGERLIQRAFNPLLPPEENIRRVKLLMGKIGEMAASRDEMAEHFRQNGSLMGYEGRQPSMSEMSSVERQFGQDPQDGELPSGVTEEDIQHTMQLHNVTREQVLERINAD